MFSDLLHRLRSLVFRSRVEAELDDELRFHYERHIERGIQSGLTPAEARRQALLAIGTSESVKEDCRDARGVSLLETLGVDLRHALRLIARSPGFASVVVCSLAIGIGANTAIFSLMNAVLWRTLPIHDPGGLYLIGARYDTGSDYGFTYEAYRAISKPGPWLSNVAAWSTVRLGVSIDGSTEPTSYGQMVTGGYFPLLGVTAARGRALGPQDDRVPNGHPVAMISYAYWERRFASDPAVVGRTVKLCDTPFTIVGVTPRDFFGIEVGKAPDFFAPSMMQPTLMPASENFLAKPILIAGWLTPIARLRAGATASQVTPFLDAGFKAAHVEGYDEPAGKWKLSLTPAANGISDLRQQFSQPLTVLMAMVAALLLMACANVANMLLARAASRAPEFAMRLTLGAARRRLVQQLLVESMVLSTAGGLLGLAVAQAGTRLLVAYISSGRTPIVLQVDPDWRVVAFTAGVSIATGLLFGLIPALRSSGPRNSVDLSGLAGKSSEGRCALLPGKILMVLQAALCVVLLASASLFVRGFEKLNARDDGFSRETVLTIPVEPRGSNQRGIPGTTPRLDQTYRALLDRVRAIPGVRAAGLAQFSPTSEIGFSSPLTLDSGRTMRVSRLMIYPDYFKSAGIPLLSGRDFGQPDLDANSPYVAIVNQTFVGQAFPGMNPVGQAFRESTGRRVVVRRIIGLVKDSVYTNLRGAPPALIFQPFLQTNTGRGKMTLHVRIAGPSTSIVSRLRAEIQKIDPSLPPTEVRSLAEEMDAAMVRERLMATLAGFFGAVALSLACVGLYGLFSFAVIRRTREIGVRMALGANAGGVIGMVMREVAMLLSIGIAIGIPAAFTAGRIASSQITGLLFGLKPTDPVSLGFAAAMLAAIAGVAGFLPAWRASRVEPVVALRNE